MLRLKLNSHSKIGPWTPAMVLNTGKRYVQIIIFLAKLSIFYPRPFWPPGIVVPCVCLSIARTLGCVFIDNETSDSVWNFSKGPPSTGV